MKHIVITREKLNELSEQGFMLSVSDQDNWYGIATNVREEDGREAGCVVFYPGVWAHELTKKGTTPNDVVPEE